MVASNGLAPTVDTSRPYTRVVGVPGVAHTQDDTLYGPSDRRPQAEQSGAALSPSSAIAEPALSTPTPADSRERRPAAERMHLSRPRRRGEMLVSPFEVRDTKIEGLVAALFSNRRR
jgi:hypothetical protein